MSIFVRVKLYVEPENEIRCFVVDSAQVKFNEVLAKARQLTGRDNIRLNWKDADNEEIVLDSQLEWEMAADSCVDGSNVVRLLVRDTAAASKSKKELPNPPSTTSTAQEEGRAITPAKAKETVAAAILPVGPHYVDESLPRRWTDKPPKCIKCDASSRFKSWDGACDECQAQNMNRLICASCAQEDCRTHQRREDLIRQSIMAPKPGTVGKRRWIPRGWSASAGFRGGPRTCYGCRAVVDGATVRTACVDCQYDVGRPVCADCELEDCATRHVRHGLRKKYMQEKSDPVDMKNGPNTVAAAPYSSDMAAPVTTAAAHPRSAFHSQPYGRQLIASSADILAHELGYGTSAQLDDDRYDYENYSGSMPHSSPYSSSYTGGSTYKPRNGTSAQPDYGRYDYKSSSLPYFMPYSFYAGGPPYKPRNGTSSLPDYGRYDYKNYSSSLPYSSPYSSSYTGGSASAYKPWTGTYGQPDYGSYDYESGSWPYASPYSGYPYAGSSRALLDGLDNYSAGRYSSGMPSSYKDPTYEYPADTGRSRNSYSTSSSSKWNQGGTYGQFDVGQNPYRGYGMDPPNSSSHHYSPPMCSSTWM